MKGRNTLSNEDPWATAEPEPDPVNEPAPTVSEVKQVETISGDEITMTFKESGGFDASWIVIRAASVLAANKILDEHVALQELMSKVKKVASFYRGGAPSAGGGGGGGRAPQGATEPPAWAPDKPEADFVYKTGVTKTGRNAGQTWHAWMPPSKEDSRKAVFFNAP